MIHFWTSGLLHQWFHIPEGMFFDNINAVLQIVFPTAIKITPILLYDYNLWIH